MKKTEMKWTEITIKSISPNKKQSYRPHRESVEEDSAKQQELHLLNNIVIIVGGSDITITAEKL